MLADLIASDWALLAAPAAMLLAIIGISWHEASQIIRTTQEGTRERPCQDERKAA